MARRANRTRAAGSKRSYVRGCVSALVCIHPQTTVESRAMVRWMGAMPKNAISRIARDKQRCETMSYCHCHLDELIPVQCLFPVATVIAYAI